MPYFWVNGYGRKSGGKTHLTMTHETVEKHGEKSQTPTCCPMVCKSAKTQGFNRGSRSSLGFSHPAAEGRTAQRAAEKGVAGDGQQVAV